MSQKKGMLLAMPERWDEACFAIPALRALHQTGLVASIVCREEQQALWESVCNARQFRFSEKTKVGALVDQIGGSWEATLAWQDGTAAKAFAKAKIERRLGPDEKKLSKLLTHPMAVHEGATEHRVRMYLKTCEELGVSVDRPEYFVASPMGIPAGHNTVLLCPGSDFGPSYEWPLDRWQELGEAMLERGKHVTVAGAVGGRGLGKILSVRLGSDVEFLHISPLSAALPMLAAHQLVIAADGSLPHLAAHAGATCVTLFGPNDIAWKRPLGKRHVAVKRHVECSPCLSPKCLMDGRCQLELDVVKVLAAIPKCF
ncbi:glycosyltransferase family 9 protein [Luteolibacter algae]|uniref:Glycosyltransferase family 9 protein n=1 Tax=Luteolibacter algae TaxID=454151 RepID=A0ABW5DB89_9BACT